MFTSIIETILLHHVGKYLNGLDKNSFNVGLIDGEITIENIGLNNTLFDQLEIPLTLKFSNIQKILIEVPWTKLDEKPTLVNIEGIDILLDLSELKSLTQSTIFFKFEQIISKIKKQLESKEEKEKQKEQKDKKAESFAEKSLIRILDNADVLIKNMHIRFQDNSSFGDHRFSFGVILKQLMMHTCNEDGQKTFYKRDFSKKVVNPPLRRELKSTEVKAYWNSEESIFVKDLIHKGLQRDDILLFMKMPFSNNKTDLSNTPNISPKKQKQGDFFKDLFKTRDKKQKQKQKFQKQKKQREVHQLSMQKMKFHPVCDLIITGQLIQNDFGQKSLPLLQSRVQIQPIKVEVEELMISQLLCLVQYYLKYTQDLFYYENKTKSGAVNNAAQHTKIFNEVMQYLFKKVPKIKSFSQIPKQAFRTKQHQEKFQQILNLQSVKNLGGFANDFVEEIKLKKQIEKAQKNIRKMMKASEDIKKLMQKTKGNNDGQVQIQIDEQGRVLINLDCEIGGVSIKINQESHNSTKQSIRLSLPFTKFTLSFTNMNNIESKLVSKDLFLEYSNLNEYYNLHQNQLLKEDFINAQFKKKGKSMTLNAKVTKKQFVFSQNLVAFIIKFIQPIHITPFFLNLFEQSTTIDSESARTIINNLMSIIPNLKSSINIELPRVQIKLKHSGIVVDCGNLSIEISQESKYEVPIELNGLFVELFTEEDRTMVLPQLQVNTRFVRQINEAQYLDHIRIELAKIDMIVPKVNIFDKLATEVFQLTKDILKKELRLIDRKRIKIASEIFFNSQKDAHNLFLVGEMLQVSSKQPYHIVLYETNVYPFVIENRFYIVLLRKRKVNYIQVPTQQKMDSLIQLLVQHIQSLSTINQLKNIWFINSKYELAGTQILTDLNKFMTFICESQNSDNLQRQLEVDLSLKKFTANFADILVQAKGINFKHILYNQMVENKLIVKNIQISIQGDKFIFGIPSENNIFQLTSTKIISEKVEIVLDKIGLSITHESISPLLQSIEQILKTTILRQAITFSDSRPIVLTCKQFFNLIQFQSCVKINQFQCSIMECAGFISQNLMIKTKIEDNLREVQLMVGGMDIFQMLKFNELIVKRIMMMNKDNSLQIKYKSLLLEISPELLTRYLVILENNKDSIISHYYAIMSLMDFVKQSSYLMSTTDSNQKISIIGSNTQLQIVETEDNILDITIHEGLMQFQKYNGVTNYIVSLMEVYINQQKSNISIPIIKNFSVILKSSLRNNKNSISLAVTKLDIFVGIYILDYFQKISKSLHSVFLRNQWVLKFFAIFSQSESKLTVESKQKNDLVANKLSVNLQIDEISMLYVRNDIIPFMKVKIKASQSALEIGQEINFQFGVQTSVLYFNNYLKIFEPVIQPVMFQTSYSKSPRLQSLKVSAKHFKIGISSQMIRECHIVFRQIQQFFRKHQESMNQIINTLNRIQDNKTHLIQKQEIRMRSQSKVKDDFTKGFAIRNYGQPRSIQPTNDLRIINLSGVKIDIELHGVSMQLSCSLENKQHQLIPIKIKSQYKHNYEILERVQPFQMKIKFKQHVYQTKFTIAKLINEKILFPDGKQVRLKAVIDNEGMSIFLIGKVKIINSTPQKFVVKVGVDFTEQIPEHTELFLPYYASTMFRLGMVSSSSLAINFPDKESLQQLQFVTFSSDHHTILLTSQISQEQIIFRLMDSMKIFNHFQFRIQCRLGDTGFVVPANQFISTSKTSLKQIKNIQINIPGIDKWISVPLNKLSESERELAYPLQKQEIKIFITLSKSKMGRLIHIYPRLILLNLTPYKFNLYTSLYESLFLVNKRIQDSTEKLVEEQMKGFFVDYVPQRDCFVLDQQRYLHLSLINSKHKSAQFVGYDSDFNRTVQLQDQNYDYQVKVSYQEQFLTQNTTIFKTTLKPKYYFINKSDYTIKVHNCTIKPNHLIAFAFPKLTPLLELELDHQGTKYTLVNEVQLTNDCRWSLLLVEQYKNQSQIYSDFQVLRFGIQLIFKEGFGYFVFSRNTDSIILSNKLEDKTLLIVDEVGIKIKYQIMPDQKRKYYPLSQTFTIELLGSENQILDEIKIDLNQAQNKQLSCCNVSTYFQSLDRVFVFQDSSEQSTTFFNQDHGKPERVVTFGIDEMSISFVFYNFQGLRCQVMYMKFAKLHLLKIDYEKIQMIELKCKNLTLISKQLNEITQILSKQHDLKDFLNLYVEMPKHANSIINFKLGICPLKICVSDELIQLILLNVDYLKLGKEKDNKKDRQFQGFFEFYDKTRQEKQGQNVLWKVSNLTIYQINVEIEFKKCYIKGNQQRMKSFGFSLAELKANGLQLSKLEINNSEQTVAQFTKAILNEYKRQIISLIGGVLGGLNILGNPKEFILEVESSIKQSNPGIMRGTGGFLKGVAIGAVNSVSKITGVVGNGLNMLSLDEQYMHERQMIKNRSMTSATDSLKAGASSLYKGIESGITGLVTQPARGLQQQGVIGILKGSFKGVLGLFTKPVIGALDAASMTTGGLASISKTSKQQQLKHQRIRPLYYQRKIMRFQCDVEETCCLFLKKYFSEYYSQLFLIQTFLLQQQQDPQTLTSVLVVSLNELRMIDILSREVTLKIENRNLGAVGKFSEGVVLYYMQGKEQQQTIFRLKRNNELKHLLYLTIQKTIQTFKVEQ